ncbi:MAG: membrane protein [Sulfuricurvum sp. PC08-66]|nr:MAG: membrane protein [Sulfuricurvum sp. PC08-66]
MIGASKPSLVGYLVRRYLRFDKEQPFIFLSALLAFLGIMLGVTVLMIAMALMNGMSKEFEQRLFVMNYPLTILPRYGSTVDEALLQKLQTAFPSYTFSPYIRTETIAKKGSQMEGGVLFGIDVAREKAINPVFATAIGNNTLEKFEVIVGQTLFEEMYMNFDEKLTYIFTDLAASGFTVIPKMKRLSVVGAFESGLSNYDKAFHYTLLESTRAIKGWEEGEYSGIHVSSPQPMRDIEAIAALLPPTASVMGWWEQNGNFFSALELEKKALFIVLMLIILIAAINIISSLLMTVMNRRSEIALLLSLGATPQEVKKLFIALGLIIGTSGIIVGLLLGGASMWVLGSFDIISLPKDVYGTTKLPLDLDTFDLVGIIVGAFVIVLISSFYPAKKASSVDALQVLRNE